MEEGNSNPQNSPPTSATSCTDSCVLGTLLLAQIFATVISPTTEWFLFAYTILFIRHCMDCVLSDHLLCRHFWEVFQFQNDIGFAKTFVLCFQFWNIVKAYPTVSRRMCALRRIFPMTFLRASNAQFSFTVTKVTRG